MIEFIEETHQYINSKGIEIPSVSKLIKFQFPGQYNGVPEGILKAKASYGSKVHALVESYEKGDITLENIRESKIDPNLKSAVNQYAKVKEKYLIRVKSMEQIVSYKERYAGTYDILTEDNYLIDMKTTSSLHMDWLECQLGLYYLGLGIERDIGYCLWLPKSGAGQLVMVNVWNNERCKELIERYENDIQVSDQY